MNKSGIMRNFDSKVIAAQERRVYQDELDACNKINLEEDMEYRKLMNERLSMNQDYHTEEPLFTQGTLLSAVILTICIVCAIVLIFVSCLNIS